MAAWQTTPVNDWETVNDWVTTSGGDHPAKDYSLGGFGANAMRSGGDFFGGIAQSLAHPVDTVSNLGQVAFGALEKPVRKGMEFATGRDIAPTPEEQRTNAVIDSYRNRYKNGPLDAAYEDPFGVASDLSMLAGGAAGVLGDANKAGRIAATVSNATNPANLFKLPAQGARAAGGALAEHGIGVGWKDRLRGKTPGRGLLDETGWAIRPSTIATRADEAMTRLNNELESKAKDSKARTNIGAARQIAEDVAQQQAQGLNQPLAAELGDVAQSLRKAPPNFYGATEYPAGAFTPVQGGKMNPFSGQRGPFSAAGKPIMPNGAAAELEIAAEQSPIDSIRMKREFNDRNVAWNQIRSDKATRLGREVYHGLDNAIDQTVPGAHELNQRISSLIPVKDAAIRRGAQQGMVGEIAGTIKRPTGGVASAAAMGGGNPVVGLVKKAVLSAPETQIAIGKALNAPYALGNSNLGGLLGKATVGQRAAQAALINNSARGTDVMPWEKDWR